ncbi:hypothetical protein H2198_009698 [Neophaeococcomyces mojaviensis]|uniref:Uncharacterized protein n=1 Tax=Neophaeococcomyces mojaviensis TaxID=3383035 RepID=A0ACC2ZTX8_9EURO|nr:hypothetical protein H2198_009698 [Knufia sp. JES_112]
MPYTKARLEHALKIFRETAPYKLQRGLPSGNLERRLRRNYSLRDVSRTSFTRTATVWQDRDSGGNSDDEYDPKEERKKLKAAATRKKKNNQKRKAEEEAENDRKTKKVKGEEPCYDSNSAYLTLVLTTEKGRSLLADLAHTHNTSCLGQQHDQECEKEPSYWRRSSGSKKCNSSKLAIHELTGSELDAGADNDVEAPISGLRDGKVLDNENNAGFCRSLDGEDSRREKIIKQKTAKDSVQNHEDHTLSAKTGSVKKTGSHSYATIEIEHNENNVTSSTALSLSKVAPSMLRRKPKPVVSKPVTSGSANTSLSAFSVEKARHAHSFRDESGLITIETCYAHPIDFKHIPQTGGEPCDFCSNYRMSVIGLGKKFISVFIDPDVPTKVHEVGDGWRSKGVPATKMCVSCALGRLMITRCHTLGTGSARQQQFMKIPLLNSSEENRRAYLRDLFDPSKRPNHFSESAGKREGPLPSCNLCPAPAFWKCCKWQNRDKMNAPCRVPSSATVSEPWSAVQALSSSRSPSVTPSASLVSMTRESTPIYTPPASTLPVNKVSNKIINGKKRQVICLDSDSDDDILPQAKQRITAVDLTGGPTQSFQIGTSQTSQRSNSIAALQSGLRPPIQGCGLKLCHPCKLFVEARCDGSLDRRKVMEFLRKESKLGPRADLRFLFQGSELERAYEQAAVKKL